MDDFIFPAIQIEKDSSCELPFPHYAASPLWFLSSVSDETNEGLNAFSDDEGAHDQFVNKEEGMDALWEDFNEDQFVNKEEGMDALWEDFNEEQFVNKEEGMDALWEDFNEELRRVSSEWVKKDFKGLKVGSVIKVSDSEFTVTKNRSLHNYRKLRLVAMLKVLKKLFLVQKNSSASNELPNPVQSVNN